MDRDVDIERGSAPSAPRRHTSRRWRLHRIAVAALLLTACTHPDYRRDLTNGFRLVRANADEVVITDSTGTVVIRPTITAIGQRGDVVYGITARPGHLEERWSTPGHFIVNTATGAARMGLSREEWLAELARRGVAGEPRLVRPSRSGEL
jgi:hypothetical protein